MSTPIDYAIYPSLLDAYLRFTRNDDDETFDSLFDKINKVQTPQTEHQLRGVEFEDFINKKLDGIDLPIVDVNGIEHYQSANFQFKRALVDKIHLRLQHATEKQKYIQAIIPSHVGNIKLYGIVDYAFPDMMVDLKVPEAYKCNKYKDNSQHPVYSFIEKVKQRPLKAFKYLATDLKYDYVETYIPTENMHRKMLQTVFEFINFINYFKPNITNEKIFGGETGPVPAAIEVPAFR